MKTNETLALKGKEIYDRNLKRILEPRSNGKFVAIEVESGDYFLGSTITDAIAKGEKKHPTKLFYVMRVGHKAACSIMIAGLLTQVS